MSPAARAATVEREVEGKWRVHPPFVVPELTGDGFAAVSADEPVTVDLRAVYYDTADLRLAREGVTLRHRSGEGDKKDGWHLKLPVAEAAVPDASSGVRDELHVPGPPDAIPESLRDLITAYVRTAVLGPVATLVTQRTTRVLRDADGAPLGELTDDLVSVLSSGHVAGRFREIEFEAVGEQAHETLAAVGDRLRAHGAVGGEFVPKVVRALGPQATGAPDPPPPEPVAGKEPAHVAIRMILRRYVRALIAADVTLRRGSTLPGEETADSQIVDDAVHKMRVAARRLRSALRTFGPLLDPQWATDLAEELKWLADALGQARDSEVLLARLLRDLDSLPPELVLGDARERLTKAIGGDLAAGNANTLETMRSERYVVLLERLVDAAWEPLTTPDAEQRTDVALPPLIDAAWQHLKRRVKRLRSDDATNHMWHKARISAKRVRYAGEAVAPIFGAAASDFAKRVEALQEVLGEHQDAVVAGETLLRLGSAPRAGAVSFTFGLLHARQDEAMRVSRAEFPEMWSKAKAPKLRKWLSA